jgi:hypothetical protein
MTFAGSPDNCQPSILVHLANIRFDCRSAFIVVMILCGFKLVYFILTFLPHNDIVKALVEAGQTYSCWIQEVGLLFDTPS